MRLKYEGAGQKVILDIDRAEKKLRVKSSLTNMAWVKRSWSDLFDPGMEQMQHERTKGLTDQHFIDEINKSMKSAGYNLKAVKL